MKPFIQLATKHQHKLHSSTLAFFFSCRDPFACIPSFLIGGSDIPKKSSCSPSWSFSRKLKHQTVIQRHTTHKTHRAGQQGRQNAEWTQFATFGFVGDYLLTTALVNPPKVHPVPPPTQPTWQRLRFVLWGGPHICQSPPEAETSRAEILSQEVLHGPLFYRQLSQAAAENL